jgi:hypothetical protein
VRLVEWLAVNALFVAINVAVGLLFWAFFAVLKRYAPELAEQPVVVALSVLAIIGAVLWLTFIALRPRGRARAKA